MSTFSQTAWPKARVEHTCQLCARTIRPGETYRRSFVADGNAWTWKECAHCSTLMDVVEWDDDTYGDDTVCNWQPETVAHLRLKALWRKKWARKDESLYPIPTLVIAEDRYGFGRVVDVVMSETSGDPVWPPIEPKAPAGVS